MPAVTIDIAAPTPTTAVNSLTKGSMYFLIKVEQASVADLHTCGAVAGGGVGQVAEVSSQVTTAATCTGGAINGSTPLIMDSAATHTTIFLTVFIWL